MLCTTTLFFGSYNLATCLPEVENLIGYQGLTEVVRRRRSEVKKFMNTAACGCFELALEFKLFAIGVSVSSAPLRLASLVLQFSYGTASVREGFA